MSDRRELPLLAWEPPGCSVVLFPVSRRVGAVRKAAQWLAGSRTQREAGFRWRRSLDTLYGHLEHAGVSGDVFAEARADFIRLVWAECARIRSPWLPEHPDAGNEPPDGAA